MRGFGESDAPAETSAYAMQNSIDDMTALLTHLKVNK
jgi:pimeloyl-ACP methyl ester carboxylesterase